MPEASHRYVSNCMRPQSSDMLIPKPIIFMFSYMLADVTATCYPKFQLNADVLIILVNDCKQFEFSGCKYMMTGKCH